jgi:hypothetical protein
MSRGLFEDQLSGCFQKKDFGWRNETAGVVTKRQQNLYVASRSILKFAL